MKKKKKSQRMIVKMQPYASWTNDFQGKQDFDGPLLSISTRYYPGASNPEYGTYIFQPGKKMKIVPYGKFPSAISSIILSIGPKEEDDGGGNYLIWREKEFEGETETLVKSKVEAWVTEQIKEIVKLLGGQSSFQKA